MSGNRQKEVDMTDFTIKKDSEIIAETDQLLDIDQNQTIATHISDIPVVQVTDMTVTTEVDL